MPDAVLDGPPLFGVKFLQVSDGHWGPIGAVGRPLFNPDSCFVRSAGRRPPIALVPNGDCSRRRIGGAEGGGLVAPSNRIWRVWL